MPSLVRTSPNSKLRSRNSKRSLPRKSERHRRTIETLGSKLQTGKDRRQYWRANWTHLGTSFAQQKNSSKRHRPNLNKPKLRKPRGTLNSRRLDQVLQIRESGR